MAFFEQLSEEEAAKVQVLFERLAERGRTTTDQPILIGQQGF